MPFKDRTDLRTAASPCSGRRPRSRGFRPTTTSRTGEVIRSSFGPPPRILSDSLFLTAVSGFSEFRGLFQALASMGFYNINPMTVRDLQDHDEGRLLRRDGSNLASVLRRLEAEGPGDVSNASATISRRSSPPSPRSSRRIWAPSRPSNSGSGLPGRNTPGGSSPLACRTAPCGRSASWTALFQAGRRARGDSAADRRGGARSDDPIRARRRSSWTLFWRRAPRPRSSSTTHTPRSPGSSASRRRHHPVGGHGRRTVDDRAGAPRRHQRDQG